MLVTYLQCVETNQSKLLFQKWSQNVKNPIMIQPGMEEVTVSDGDYDCPCRKTTSYLRDEL